MADTQNFETAAHDAFKDAGSAAQKSFEDLTTFGQENLDAALKAQAVASRAAEELNAEFVAYTKKTLEESVAHAKTLAASKTLTELMDKQTGYARLAMDGFVQQSTRMNEMLLDAARGVMEPFNARLAAAAELTKVRAA